MSDKIDIGFDQNDNEIELVKVVSGEVTKKVPSFANPNWSSVGGDNGILSVDDSGVKLDKWYVKMDEYYSNVDREQLMRDLAEAGLEVKEKCDGCANCTCKKDT